MTAFSSRFRLARLLAAKARRRGRAIGKRLTGVFIINLVVRTVKEMSDDDATHMAAGVAYYALFSLFPLLLGLIALFSFFTDLRPNPDAPGEPVTDGVTRFITDYLPGSEALVSDNIEVLLNLRGAVTVFAALGLFWSASAVFGAVNRAVNRAWDVHQDRPFYLSKTRQLIMAAGVGALFMLSLGAAALVRASARFAELDSPQADFLINSLGSVFLQGTSFVLTLSVFLLLYKFTPNTKTYWRFIWPGALVGAAVFELAKNLFIAYLNGFARFDSVYGSLAPVIVLLLWTYLSSLIVIAGAELSSEYGRLRMGVSRGELLHPRNTR